MVAQASGAFDNQYAVKYPQLARCKRAERSMVLTPPIQAFSGLRVKNAMPICQAPLSPASARCCRRPIPPEGHGRKHEFQWFSEARRGRGIIALIPRCRLAAIIHTPRIARVRRVDFYMYPAFSTRDRRPMRVF